jgi:hypothetical protein
VFFLSEPGADPEFSSDRITRIVTSDFPHYFAVVTRIRQEIHAIGPEGGIINSNVVPQVQAIFPDGALTKKIKVGLQVSGSPSNGCMGRLMSRFRKHKTAASDSQSFASDAGVISIQSANEPQNATETDKRAASSQSGKLKRKSESEQSENDASGKRIPKVSLSN